MNDLEVLKQRLSEMEAKTASLFTEKKALEADNKSLEAEKQEAIEEAEELRESLAAKELELQLLLRRIFGPQSERFIDDPQQLKLDFNDADQVQDAINSIEEAIEEQEQQDDAANRKRKRRKRHQSLPDNLPREIVNVDLPDDEKEGLTYIGYDSTETLGYVPPKFRIIETRYFKYVRENEPDAGVNQPPRQPGIVEGNRYDIGVAAQVVVAKYGYHLPVYRQQDIFASSGWQPSRSTLLNILVNVAALIRPLIEFFAHEVRRDGTVGSDDTGVTLLLPKNIPKVDESDPKSQRVHDVITKQFKKESRT